MSEAADRPATRFLGSAEASGGPFALLGLPARPCEDETVVAALQRQLERVNVHPQCDTPAADEVRLSLHAAAAQLLDPAVRRHLVTRWSGHTPEPTLPVPVSAAPSSQRSRLALEHDAILTLGLFGGWNRRSLQRLTMIAHARGISSHELATTLQTLGRRRGGRGGVRRVNGSAGSVKRSSAHQERAAGADSRGQRSEPPASADPSERIVKLIVLAGIVVTVFIGFAVSGLIIAALPKDTPDPEVTNIRPDPSEVVDDREFQWTGESVTRPIEGDSKEASTATDARATRLPNEDLEPGRIRRDLIACTEALAIAPEEAIARFEQSVASLARSWCSFTPSQLVATHHAVVEFVYRSAGLSAIGGRAVDAVLRESEPLLVGLPEADEVWGSIWSAGMVARLKRERDLPASSQIAIQSRLAELFAGGVRPGDDSFRSGAVAALTLIPNRLLSDVSEGSGAPDSWSRWLECVDAALASDVESRMRVVLATLERVLIHGPEPTRDRGMLEVVNALVVALGWRDGDESRRWLMRWFDDRAVSDADLYAVTTALARSSSAPGVDQAMVLSPSADDRARVELRDRYAGAWGLSESVDRDQLVLEWIELATRLAGESVDGEPVDLLGHAARYARLNEAASWIWRGQPAAATRVLDHLEGPVETILMMAPGRVRGGGDDNQEALDWPVRYLDARRNIPVREQLLSEIGGVRTIASPVAAEVLAREAVRGSPLDIRLQAGQIVILQAHNPIVVNALLEMLPINPTIRTSRLIEDVTASLLPATHDDRWPIAARRALVEHLLELVASEGELARTDLLAALVSESYAQRRSATPLGDSDRTALTLPAADVSAGALFDRWHDEAERAIPSERLGVSLSEIDLLRAGRARLAGGPVQRFAAQQVSLAEAMAYVVAGERPGVTASIIDELADIEIRRGAARHIFGQIAHVERMMTRLWLLRFGEVLP